MATATAASKPQWQSKTLWGLVITFGAPFLAKYGLSETDLADIAGIIGGIAAGLGALWGYYGRITAKHNLT